MKSTPRRWLLLGAVVLGVIAGSCVLLWSWSQHEAGRAWVNRSDGIPMPFFRDPAFSPSACAADLKQAAERAAEELVKAFPESPHARDILAQTHDRLGALGAQSGERQEVNPSPGEYLKPDTAGLGARMEQHKSVNGGVAATRRIAVKIHLDVGRCYRQHGQAEKAIEMLRKAAALGPQDIPSRTELFAIYAKTGRDREALEVCRQLCRIEPDRGDHWLNLALLRVRRDDLEGAKRALSRAREIDPGNVQYREAEELLARKN